MTGKLKIRGDLAFAAGMLNLFENASVPMLLIRGRAKVKGTSLSSSGCSTTSTFPERALEDFHRCSHGVVGEVAVAEDQHGVAASAVFAQVDHVGGRTVRRAGRQRMCPCPIRELRSRVSG
jgi:hypothetical protein